MDTEVLVQIGTVFGALIAGLGSALFFTIRYMLRRAREDTKMLIDTFKRGTDSYEKSIELFKRAIESIEIANTKLMEDMKLAHRRMVRLRKEVQQFREEMKKCA